jgi:hypothetical protein
VSDHSLIALIKAANYDLTSAKAKLLEIERQVAALNLTLHEARFVCPVPYCGLKKTTKQQLFDHLIDVHGYLHINDTSSWQRLRRAS